MDAPTVIMNDPTYSSTMTEAQPTLTSADRINNDQMKKFLTSTIKPKDTLSGTLSAPPAKLNSNVSRPHNLTYLTEDSQQTSSHSSPTDIPEPLITQVNSRQHKPGLQTHKRRRHQYRLCYNCRQTTHLKAHCPQLLFRNLNNSAMTTDISDTNFSEVNTQSAEPSTMAEQSAQTFIIQGHDTKDH